MTKNSNTPTLAEVIKSGIKSSLTDVHTCMPARVVRYYDDKKAVDVQPLIKVAYFDEELQRKVDSLPQINSVPVLFYGAGQYRVTVPITPGLDGTLFLAEQSLDVWLSLGGIVDPQDDRRFSLADGLFLPGLRDFKNPLRSPVPIDRMTMGDDEGLQIHIDGTKIKIGSYTDLEIDAVALATPIKGWMNAVKTAFDGHTHAETGGITGTPTTGAPPTPPLPAAPNLDSQSIFAKK